MCVLAFNKKSLLEASGMVFRFHSLQVTYFGISQSDCIKKNSSREEKKLVVKLNWQPLIAKNYIAWYTVAIKGPVTWGFLKEIK